jgi:hypothetical protein
VRKHSAKSDGSANEGIKLLVATDGELQVAGRDALDLEVLGRILWRVSRGQPHSRFFRRRNEGWYLRLPTLVLQRSGIRERQ